jgi:hypothetical protein
MQADKRLWRDETSWVAARIVWIHPTLPLVTAERATITRIKTTLEADLHGQGAVGHALQSAAFSPGPIPRASRRT